AAPQHQPAADTPSSQPSSGPSVLVIGLGSLGVVGLAAGTVLGFMAKSKYDDSKHFCSTSDVNRCTQQGVSLRDDAFTLGNSATAGFIVGGVALASAGVIWLVSGSSKPASASGRAATTLRAGIDAGPRRSGILVEGSF